MNDALAAQILKDIGSLRQENTQQHLNMMSALSAHGAALNAHVNDQRAHLEPEDLTKAAKGILAEAVTVAKDTIDTAAQLAKDKVLTAAEVADEKEAGEKTSAIIGPSFRWTKDNILTLIAVGTFLLMFFQTWKLNLGGLFQRVDVSAHVEKK